MYKSALVFAAALASASAFAPASRFVVSRTVVRAEPEDMNVGVDYEEQMAKLQKECEDRIDNKVAELMQNIETVGQEK